jgi:sigma-B regulation protein RsbU (phosphoserine phosphatase)
MRLKLEPAQEQTAHRRSLCASATESHRTQHVNDNSPKVIPLQDRTLVVGPATASAGGGESEARIQQLVVIEGPEQGRMITLDANAITLGRAAPSDILLRDIEISRVHCRLYLENGERRIADLQSTNGTFVDGRRITAPARLTDGCVVTIGRHRIKVERRTQREIELAHEFERSLEGASRYVQSMLPPPISDGPVRTEWLLIPCARLGGDALGYQWIDADHFALYLLDVSGHGPEAAMLAVSVMNALRQKSLPGADPRDPQQVVTHLNAAFQMEAHSQMYFTLWYGVFGRATRVLSYCSAGQHPAYLAHGGSADPQPLRTANPPVGVTAAHPFQAGAAVVPPGATLYLFSDGVFEVETISGKRWELENLLPTLAEAAVPDLAETQRIYQSVQKVARRGPLDDDFSVLVTRFL